jgi:glyoxylase-like metal-dependent hydrolase (beta-lactamase superfamily II)
MVAKTLRMKNGSSASQCGLGGRISWCARTFYICPMGCTAPVAKEAIPTQTYDSNYGPVLQVAGRTALVGHPSSAHTDTDSWVLFPDANVLAMGDTTSLGQRYPTIDYANGGSINGIINTVNNYLEITNGQTKYVPGHGPLATRADIPSAGSQSGPSRNDASDRRQAGGQQSRSNGGPVGED